MYSSGGSDLTDTLVEGNVAVLGGGVYLGGGSHRAVLRGVTIRQNEAETGGGLYAEGDVTLKDGLLELNAAQSGGGIYLEDGATLTCDLLYGALGVEPLSGLARAVGVELDAEGFVSVDGLQRSSVEDFYAAGDVVKSLNQIAVAMGQAAIAATNIHRRLLDEGVRPEASTAPRDAAN